MDVNMVQIIQGVLVTLGTLLVFVAIVYCGNIIFDQQKLNRSLHLQRKYKFFEFTIFKFSLYALFAYWIVNLLLQWWGISKLALDAFNAAILKGTIIYGIRIIPMRLIIALLVFSSIQMSWKYALVYFSRSDKFDPEAETQIVITSLLSYVVLAIAILCGLAVSGVDFTGLAIVAGALSVGIGFGLQNIVNNFVSGIILLLEKPIKPGDRVLIKGYEGFVREISFRYTRIETLQKEDVIIPNSDLITTPIVNYEFDNKLSKITCKVGVAYNSDLDMVKETLINVALKHPEVLHDPLHHPHVYMTEFGDSNLLFELNCVVNDVNKKSDIFSELNLQIARAFKDNNIEISHPTHDVHIIREA
ncbi:MAG TPA: mechanosensitive ion channel domain-containing protein [Gammaproteobacteria bacterium]|nr:mechanosensitive ion channel domain-containing protein [Gammaproteobacteria bacterium]